MYNNHITPKFHTDTSSWRQPFSSSVKVEKHKKLPEASNETVKSRKFQSHPKKEDGAELCREEILQPDPFLTSISSYFTQAVVESGEGFDKLEQYIKDLPFIKKVKAIEDLISIIDIAGTYPLSQNVYTAIGRFFFERVLIPECKMFVKRITEQPLVVSKNFVRTYTSIRSLVHFRQGKIFLEWIDDECSIGALMITLALKHCYPETRLKLIEIARQENEMGSFFKKLFLEGSLAGFLTIGTGPCPALDLGAYALLLLNDDFAIRQANILKKQEEASYIKRSSFSTPCPEELIQRLREKSKGLSIVFNLEKIIEDYVCYFYPRINQREADKSLANSLNAITERFLCINPCSPNLPQEIDEIPAPYELVEEIQPLPSIERPLPSTSESGLKSILNLIEIGQEEGWSTIQLYFEKLLIAFPDYVETLKIEVAVTLIEKQWKTGLRQFVINYLSVFPEELWNKIHCLSDRAQTIKSLKTLNLLMELFSDGEEVSRKLYLREQILTRLRKSGEIVLNKEEGELYVVLCSKICATFRELPPDQSTYLDFVTVTSCAEGNQEGSEPDLLPFGEEILTFNLCYLHDNCLTSDRKLQGEHSALLRQIIYQKTFTKDQRQIIGKIIERINNVFLEGFIKEEKNIAALCDEYFLFLTHINHPEMGMLLHETQNVRWLLVNCWYDVHKMKKDEKINLKTMAITYPAIFQQGLIQNSSIRNIIIKITRLYLDFIIENIDSVQSDQQPILRDLLLYVHNYKLFDIHLEEIIKQLIGTPNRVRTHTALRILSGFIHLKNENGPLVSFELLTSIIPSFFEEKLALPPKTKLPMEWDRDVIQLSDLIYSNFYLNKEQNRRAEAKEALSELIQKSWSIALSTHHYYVLNRALLRQGPCIQTLKTISHLKELLRIANLNKGQEHVCEAGLLYGRLTYHYMVQSKKNPIDWSKILSADRLRRIKVYKADLESILQPKTSRSGKNSPKQKSRTGTIEDACALVELFGCHLAELGCKKPKQSVNFDVLWWNRLTSIPYIKAFNEMEKPPVPFRNAMVQARVSFGLALMNYKPSLNSFNLAVDILMGFKKQRFKYQHTYLIFQLYKKIFISLMNDFGKELDFKDKRNCYFKLINNEFLDFLKFNSEFTQVRQDFIQLMHTVFETLVKNKEPKEFVFKVWEVLKDNLTYMQRKIIMDHWVLQTKENPCNYKKGLKALKISLYPTQQRK